MKNRLIFSTIRDDNVLVLEISFFYFLFSGVGRCYISEDDLMSRLKGFESYPINGNVNPCIEGGYYNEDMSSLKETHLHLSVRQVDLRGGVGMKIVLANSSDDGKDFFAQSTIDIRVEYEKLKEIVASIKAAVNYGEAEVLL